MEFAARPENRYILGKSTFVPGDLSEYVRYLDGYRCVFTLTEHQEKIYRHLSISVPVPDKLPNTVAAFTIATWFGFTGALLDHDVAVEPGEDWQISPDEKGYCIVLAQELSQ